MFKYLAFAILFSTAAQAQQFVPITIDAQKYQQIDDAMGKLAMPRDAHVAWAQLWQSLEKQAQDEAAHKKPDEK